MSADPTRTAQRPRPRSGAGRAGSIGCVASGVEWAGSGGDFEPDVGEAHAGGGREQALVAAGAAAGGGARRAPGQVGLDAVRLGRVEQAVQVVEQQVSAVFAPHGASLLKRRVVFLRTAAPGGQSPAPPSGFSTRRSFCSALRICVFTVPTGAWRMSAICS